MTTVLKIGGSVLTDKSSEKTIDLRCFNDALETVSRHHEDLVLVHGAGSFGHPQADRIGLGEGTDESVHEVYEAVMELNSKVVQKLEENGVETFPVHPSSCSYRGNGFKMMTEQIEKALKNGFTPVMHGDCVVTDNGLGVVSGDTVAARLSRELDAERLGMCASTAVKDGDGGTVEEVRRMDDFPSLENGDRDVTGGIPRKVERLLESGEIGRIFGPDSLKKFLDGGEPGTLVNPR
ncbi:MAG: isopentenyl phosphate kinase [Candidatus Nanohaloarchaea archaeon]